MAHSDGELTGQVYDGRHDGSSGLHIPTYPPSLPANYSDVSFLGRYAPGQGTSREKRVTGKTWTIAQSAIKVKDPLEWG